MKLNELKTVELQRIDLKESKINDIILKGGRKRTDIKMSRELMNDINLEIKECKISTKYLIPNPKGDKLSDQSINNIIKSIGKHTGIEGVTSTLIRRTVINHKIARNAQDILSIS